MMTQISSVGFGRPNPMSSMHRTLHTPMTLVSSVFNVVLVSKQSPVTLLSSVFNVVLVSKQSPLTLVPSV